MGKPVSDATTALAVTEEPIPCSPLLTTLMGVSRLSI